MATVALGSIAGSQLKNINGRFPPLYGRLPFASSTYNLLQVRPSPNKVLMAAGIHRLTGRSKYVTMTCTPSCIRCLTVCLSIFMTPSTVPSHRSGLAPHEHQMRLWGSPERALFPAICPNCGSAAFKRIAVSKGFIRSSGSDTPDSRIVMTVNVPFCDACTVRHLAEAGTSNLWSKLLSGFNSGEMFGAIGFAAAAAFTGFQGLGELLRGRLSHFAVFGALTLFFGLIARFLARSAWLDTEYFRVQAQTSVTKAFDFSDNEPAPFESPQYDCTMRDGHFAAAFATLNRPSEFKPGSPAALADLRSANRQAWIVGIVVFAIALFFAIRSLLK
jgi:hypothetical protein